MSKSTISTFQLNDAALADMKRLAEEEAAKTAF
jgi:hypothetical protein